MASSSSRLCSDEELQKARVDLDEFLADEDDLDEFLADEDELGCLSGDEHKEEGKETLVKKKKKKKKVVAPMEMVQTFLNKNFKSCIPVLEHKTEYVGKMRHLVDRITALQDKLRHEVEAKGYAEYEVTDDEDEEEQEQEEKHQDTPPASGTNAH